MQAHALSGHTDESADPDNHHDTAENGSPQTLAVPTTSTKKGVSGKLKSFFANKFKKTAKGSNNNSAASSNRASAASNAPIGIQNQDENA